MKKVFVLPAAAALAVAMGVGAAFADEADKSASEVNGAAATTAAPEPAPADAEPAPVENGSEDVAIDVEAAGIYAQIPGIRAVEDINGLKAWTAPDQTLVFMRDQETGNYIVGFPFDADGKTLIPGAADVEDSGIDALLSGLFTPRINIPDTYAPTVEERLSRLTEEERGAAVDALIEAVREVKDEAEFNAAIDAWLEDLPEGAETAEAEDAVPADADVEQVTEYQTEVTEATEDQTEVTEDQTEVTEVTEDQAAATEEQGPTLIDAVRNAAYVEIGDRSAPLAYAILDPACHPCRAALNEIKDRVADSEIQLRVLLLAAVNADSPGVIAGLAQSDDLGEALMALGAEEDAELPFARPSTMSDAVSSGISENYELARDYELPSLPFFIFEKEDGPVYFAGLPSEEQFEGIILADADRSAAAAE